MGKRNRSFEEPVPAGRFVMQNPSVGTHQKREEIMSIERVRAHLKQFGIEERIQEFSVSSATVELDQV